MPSYSASGPSMPSFDSGRGRRAGLAAAVVDQLFCGQPDTRLVLQHGVLCIQNAPISHFPFLFRAEASFQTAPQRASDLQAAFCKPGLLCTVCLSFLFVIHQFKMARCCNTTAGPRYCAEANSAAGPSILHTTAATCDNNLQVCSGLWPPVPSASHPLAPISHLQIDL